jgi:hypothetical protein
MSAVGSGITFLMVRIWLHCAWPGSLAEQLQLSSASQSELSITPSKASSKAMKEAARRMQLRVVQGRPFLLLPAPMPSLEPFSWPLKPHTVRQDEVAGAGYDGAVVWLQKNVCPQGVIAVLKNKENWLEW